MLNQTNADAVATAYCADIGVTDPAAIDKWKKLMRAIYYSGSGSLINAIGVTLPINTVITVGSAATQTGPTTPVVLTVS